MKGGLEYKSSKGPIKDLDMKRRVVTGYLSAFGNVDSTDDVMEPGAFAKSLNERKEQIFFLNQHKWDQPHGKFQVLEEDKKGLYFESTPLLDTTYSSDLLKLYEAGIINEHSIGYSAIKHDQDQKGVRHLREVKLYEGSNVTIGANSQTQFTGFKGIKEINDQAQLIYKAYRNGTFTDETFTLLELALKQLQRDAYEMGRKDMKESLAQPSDDIAIIEPIQLIKEFNKELFKK